MASKTTPNPDDPKQISTDSQEIYFSLQDLAANQLSNSWTDKTVKTIWRLLMRKIKGEMIVFHDIHT